MKFLENSRVQSSTLEMKREFLTKKGLTSEEIASAFSKASQAAPTQQVQVQQKMDMQQAPMPVMLSQTTFSSKLRDLLNILLLIGGASYGARYLWKVRFKY